MFQKIHSYEFRELVTREDLTYLQDFLPVTAEEKKWLRTMLESEEAHFFITRESIEKIKDLLQSYQPEEQADVIIEKASTSIRQKKIDRRDVFHACKRAILFREGIRLSYHINSGQFYESREGIPYKLEYAVHKKQWYLLWMAMEEEAHSILSTPIYQITHIECFPAARFDVYYDRITEVVKTEKRKAIISMNPYFFQNQQIDKERQRILYAFSCFDKEVHFDEENHTYEMTVYYRQQEEEDLLVKIRMLGQRLIVKEPEKLRERMRETAGRASGRYR